LPALSVGDLAHESCLGPPTRRAHSNAPLRRILGQEQIGAADIREVEDPAAWVEIGSCVERAGNVGVLKRSLDDVGPLSRCPAGGRKQKDPTEKSPESSWRFSSFSTWKENGDASGILDAGRVKHGQTF